MGSKQEKREQRSQKLEAVGRLAVGLTHEINNKLGPILIYTQLAQMDQPGEKLARQLEAIEANTLAVKEIIETLANFAWPQAPALTRVHVSRSLFNAVKLLKYRFESEGADVRFQLNEDLPRVRADRGQLELAFLTLTGNALDAIAGQEKAELLVQSTEEEGQAVIRFIDNGPGLSAEAQEKLFDPYFSTKDGEQGTGTGLSSAYGIIRSHGGQLEVGRRADGPGTTFTIRLPIIPGGETDDENRRPDLMLDPERTYRILLVDDDQPTLSMIEAVFSGVAQMVFTTATDGDEARMLLEQDNSFDLVVCDLKMPRLDGPELYQALKQTDPAAAGRLVFITGSLTGTGIARFLDETGVACLAKPFTVADITQLILGGLGLRPEGER